MKLISETAEYALRAAVWLAQEAGRDWSTQQIAQATQTPPDYLAKVLKQLAKAGVLRVKRGSGGGFRLGGEPASICILDIVRAVDPLERIHVCPLGRAEHKDKLCPLHGRIDYAIAQMEAMFAQSTLADLLEGQDGDGADLNGLAGQSGLGGRSGLMGQTRRAGLSLCAQMPAGDTCRHRHTGG